MVDTSLACAETPGGRVCVLDLLLLRHVIPPPTVLTLLVTSDDTGVEGSVFTTVLVAGVFSTQLVLQIQ
jgi:hypothetical protein